MLSDALDAGDSGCRGSCGAAHRGEMEGLWALERLRAFGRRMARQAPREAQRAGGSLQRGVWTPGTEFFYLFIQLFILIYLFICLFV